MKKAIIICAMLAATVAVKAQSVSTNSAKWEDTKKTEKTAVAQANEFSNTVMAVNNGKISFAGLPEMNKPTWAVITDRNGETIKEMKITPTVNEMEVSKLQKGMYFVTLVNRNAGKKAFVLNL